MKKNCQQQKGKTLFEFIMCDLAKHAVLKKRGMAYNKTVKELRKMFENYLERNVLNGHDSALSEIETYSGVSGPKLLVCDLEEGETTSPLRSNYTKIRLDSPL